MPGEPRIDETASWPLTEAQTGLWYAQRIDPANPILNTGQYLDLAGPLDVSLFEQAFARAASEIDVLALRFEETRDGVRQRVDEAQRPVLAVVDMSREADPLAAALAVMAADTSTPLDPTRDKLSAFHLYRLGPGRHLFYERIHHLAIDGYGIVLVTNRVAELYSALVEGREPPAARKPLHLAFDEDAAYRTSARRAEDRDWWLAEMRGLPEIVSLAPGRAVTAHRFIRHTMSLSPGRLAPIASLAESAGVSWPDALTTLVAAYCRRMAGTPEAMLGVPHMGRLGSKAARVPCMLMNVLPLRLAGDDDAPMTEMLAQTSRKLAQARRRGRYRSEQLRRDLGLVGGHRRLHGPLVNVQPFDVPPKMAGLDVTLHILGAGAVDDITFTFRGDIASLHRDSPVIFEVDANPGLYSEADIAAHATRLLAFIDAAATAPTPGDVPLAGPDEARRFIFDVNATAHPVEDTTLTALIQRGMRAWPDATALESGGEGLSYRDLDLRSAALAAQLARLGAGPDALVAVALPRSLELVVALVAVLRSGAAYLPLDLDHPDARLARILESAKPVAALALDRDAPRFPGLALPVSEWDAYDGSTPTLDHPAPSNLAYVIYTSGSTGEPKGVAIEHRAIVNRLEWMRTHYGFGPRDRILQKTPATFDVSVWEFFLPLICGATLVVAPPGAHRDPAAIAALIRDRAITTAHFVPSMLSAFLAHPAAQGLRLARVFCSGEELTPGQRERFHQILTAELHNLYGPTEAAVDVSFWPAGADDTSSPVPIGYPVWNTRLYVLDERMRPLPAGVPGHLWLGGVQLARGYLGRPDLTGDRFLPDPFLPGERIYRTGDLARFRDDGAVVFLGRSDHQVKVRGLRIELGEIEAAIVATGLAREAGVVAREDRPGDRRIVAYLVPPASPANGGFDAALLRDRLAARLPDYMIPSAFVALAALPVTANGKLDRAALPAPAYEDASAREASTPSEVALGQLFAEILGRETPVGPDGDFFLLGGDSLLAVNLMLRVAEEFGRDPGLGALFEHPTVAGLAARLDAQEAAPDDGLAPLIRLGGSGGGAPLFLVHPAGGIAWGYRDLARLLGSDRPVLGLQSPALDPENPVPDDLAALAAAYADTVEAAAPDGIVHLTGWSVGGIIAQAMAVELSRRGRAVGLVAMLDSYPADCWRNEPEPDEKAALGALLAIAGHDPVAHTELTTETDVIGFLKAEGSALGRLPHAAVAGVVRAVKGTNRLVRGHVHTRYDGPLTHVQAALDHAGTALTPQLWNAYAGDIDIVPVPFLHRDMVSAQASSAISQALAPRLAAADAKGIQA
jgi:enterobactin synthetase component F